MPLSLPSITREAYLRTLQTLHPLLVSWEAWAERNAPDHWRPMLAARRRAHLLRRDLDTLGGDPHTRLVATPAWDELLRGAEDGDKEARFLGAMYVLEGSTLGGRFLAKQAEQALGLEPGMGDAYFRGHEEATGPMWREFLQQIAAVPEEDTALVIESARQTFAIFGQALKTGTHAAE